MMENQNRIVLGQPYAGALYAFFHDDYEIAQGQGLRLSSHTTHPYYKRLYGEPSSDLLDTTLMILTMFDEVYTFPADARYPKQDIGFNADWDAYKNYQKNNEKQLKEAYEKYALHKGKIEWDESLLFEETSYITYLAGKLNCPMVCGEGTRSFMKTITQDNLRSEEPLRKIKKTEELISDYRYIVAPVFTTPNLNSLQDIKNDDEVQKCARSFVKIMTGASSKNAEVSMQSLWEQALESKNLSKKVSHFCKVGDKVSFWGGFIPPVSLFTSFAAIPSYLRGKYSHRYQWHELGPTISKIEKYNVAKERANVL